MKNKKMLAVLAALVIVLVGAIGFSTLSGDKKEEQPTAVNLSEKETIKIGVLQYMTHPSLDEIYQGIKDGLAEEGFEDGKNIEIELLNPEGDQSQVQTMSKLLVEHKNDLYVGIATPAAQGLANVEKEKPVIMGAVTDPVAANLIDDMAAPGGNITGVSDQAPMADSVELISQLSPDAKTIGILYSANESNSKAQVDEFTKEANAKGFEVKEYAITSPNEIINTVNVMASNVDAVYIPVDNAVANSIETVISTANKSKTPVYSSVEDMVEKGSVASVSLSQYELGKATGRMIAKVINGADPATTPVEIYNEGSVVINQKAAGELGITISEDILKNSKVID